MSVQLIVALDYNSEVEASNLINQLDPSLCALKVGNEMFTALGTDFVRHLVEKQFKVFLDLKFHDIPNTVAKACAAAAKLGVWMVNVHAAGGLEMMQAAKCALEPFNETRPLLIAVTVLTSLEQAELFSIGISNSLETQVINLALLAQKAGLDGVVSSALEVPRIKQCCGDNFLTVTPGIRLDVAEKDDQKRIITPQKAISIGSDYLVIGRPITQAKKPAEVLHTILNSLS